MDATAVTVRVHIAKLDKTVEVNEADLPYLREQYGAVPIAEWEASQKSARKFPAGVGKSEKDEPKKDASTTTPPAP